MFQQSNRLARSASPSRNASAGHVPVMFMVASALAVAFAFSFSAQSAMSNSSSLQNIPMGQVELKGGTAKLGEIDPAAIRTNGSTTLEGTVGNGTNTKIFGFDFRLENADTSGSNTKLAVHGLSEVAFDAHGEAHVDYPLDAGLEGNKFESYVIRALKADASGANLIVSVTPSPNKTLSGDLVSCNILPAYKLDSMSDLARNGIAEMYRACVLAPVKNVDSTVGITTLKGTVYLLDVSEKLVSVQLLQLEGHSPLLNAKVELDGDRFTATGFSPIGPDTTVLVAMVFAKPIGGTRMRAQIQAIFGE